MANTQTSKASIMRDNELSQWQSQVNQFFTCHTPEEITSKFKQEKDSHPNRLLLFRERSFYMAYGEDAKTLAAALPKDLIHIYEKGEKEPFLMLGFHVSQWALVVLILLKKGYRTTMCDPME